MDEDDLRRILKQLMGDEQPEHGGGSHPETIEEGMEMLAAYAEIFGPDKKEEFKFGDQLALKDGVGGMEVLENHAIIFKEYVRDPKYIFELNVESAISRPDATTFIDCVVCVACRKMIELPMDSRVFRRVAVKHNA